MRLTVDHVPFAWSDLDEVVATFDRLGLSPQYGGVHDNGVTHMSVLGFDDGSYVELIGERERGDHGFWPGHVRADAGPAAWCIRVPDIVEECRRVLGSGRPVRGPLYGSREREDGTLVEWDRAEFGTPERRLLLPFAIEDRTPLSYRVSPSPDVAGGPLSGIGQVVLAVADLESAVGTFRGLYRFPRPVRGSVPGFGSVASFPGQPVALATPGDGDGWLADRLDRFRACPCACLLSTADVETARERFPLREPTAWPDGRVAFFDSDALGHRLGVLGRTGTADG
jgi:hypothetical protein